MKLLVIVILGDSISNSQLETSSIFKEGGLATNSVAGSKLISSIALAKPLSSEQQKKRAAMLFGNFYVSLLKLSIVLFL